MSAEDPPPTRDELLTMAYVDGELDEADRRELEDRLKKEPRLAREVAQLQKLAVIARQMAPPEPKDLEWARIQEGAVHQAGVGVGFLLVAVAVLGAIVITAVWIASSDQLHVAVRCALLAAGAGLGLLFLTVLRARMRTLPYDPYTEVER